jgi:hypothetical protein
MDRIKTNPNERIDIKDFRDGAGGNLVLVDLMRIMKMLLIPEGRVGAVPDMTARIFNGFTIPGTAVGTSTAILSQGSAITYLFEDSEAKFGLILGDELPLEYVLDFTAIAAETYRVWVRAIYHDADYENRVFWNPSGSPAQEYVSNVATRQVATWEAIYQLRSLSAPANGEWFQVAQIVINPTGIIESVTDIRQLFFEGNPFVTYAQEWGDGANDRNANRASYGAFDLHRFCQMVRRQLSDIYKPGSSTTKHMTLMPIGLSDLMVEHKASGQHANVTADNVTLNAGKKLITNAAGFTQKTLDAPILATDPAGNLPFVVEPYGRVARPHYFEDDFHYQYTKWHSAATAPDIYIAWADGGGNVIMAPSASHWPYGHGGVVALVAEAAAESSACLTGSPVWSADTNHSLLRFVCRYCLFDALTWRYDFIGIVGELVPWAAQFFYSGTTGLWSFFVNDTVNSGTVSLGVSGAPNAFKNFYFAFEDATHIKVWMSGMASELIIDTVASCGGVTFAGCAANFLLTAHCQAKSTAIRQGFIDYWAIYDQQAIHGVNGVQG